MSQIKIEYRGETITYRRDDNTWHWQGSRHGLSSLAAAEKSIDRALDGEPGKPKFKRRKAIVWEYDGRKDCEVTGQYGTEFWISFSEQRRGKTSAARRKKVWQREVYADTPENREAMKQYDAIQEEIEALRERADSVKSGMLRFADWLAEQRKMEVKGDA